MQVCIVKKKKKATTLLISKDHLLREKKKILESFLLVNFFRTIEKERRKKAVLKIKQKQQNKSVEIFRQFEIEIKKYTNLHKNWQAQCAMTSENWAEQIQFF